MVPRMTRSDAKGQDGHVLMEQGIDCVDDTGGNYGDSAAFTVAPQSCKGRSHSCFEGGAELTTSEFCSTSNQLMVNKQSLDVGCL